jgi:hypothetical protein
MTVNAGPGTTVPRVDDKGDGSHVPLVAIDGFMPRGAAVPQIISVQTPATGTNWAPFGAQVCSSLDLMNTAVASTSPNTIAAAVDLRWRYVGSTNWVTLRAGASHLVLGISNANQVEIQRADGSNTQIPLVAIAYA